jgi:hypothetical protein
MVWSGPTPIRDAANFGRPSFAAPAGDYRRTLMGLIGSGMGLLGVTWSKPPAEHPVSRMTRPDVRLSLVRAPALPPRHADFGSQFHPLSYASDPASPRCPQDSLPSRLLGFERTRLSLASSFQLSSRTPHIGSRRLQLPIGQQIIGRRFDDVGMLAVARAYEGIQSAEVRRLAGAAHRLTQTTRFDLSAACERAPSRRHNPTTAR